MKIPVETLILDLDGTLIDSRADLVSAVNHVLESLGHPRQTREQIVPRIGNGLRQLLTETLGPMDSEVLLKGKKIFEGYYADHCLDETRLYDQVDGCLREFSKTMKMAVVTNKPFGFADKILNHLGIGSLFGIVIGGDSLPESKPHPAPVLAAMKHLQANERSTVIVGDGHQDLRAGRAAGIRTCLVRYGFGYQPKLLELKPDFVIDKFDEIKEIVK